ncbi:MAG: universal stress protein [Haloarculaceae archaeon]
MYRVLLPIDRDEERATAQADAIGRLSDVAGSVEVTLLHVFDNSEEAAESELTDLEAGEQIEEVLSESGVTIETERRTGDPAEEILGMAEEVAADMIVLGGRKRSPLGTLLFGSVSQAVLLDASRPVTITGAEAKEDPSHRCQNCGETYYTRPEVEIETCRQCGGTNVEPTDQTAQ